MIQLIYPCEIYTVAFLNESATHYALYEIESCLN